MKLLVTGGLGFVGTNLALAWIRDDDVTIRVLDNGSSGPPQRPLINARIDIHQGDIRDAAAVDRAAQGVDAIVHLAAQTGVVESLHDPRLSVAVNIDGTLNVLEAARRHGVTRVVCASSNAAVGRHEPPLDEQCVPRPISPYGATKLAGEGLCAAYADAYGLETVSLRFSNLFGPWSVHKGSVVAAFFRRILAGQPLVIDGDGRQTRDFLFADDLTRAIRLAVERPGVGRVYQVASGRETSIGELATACIEIAQRYTGRPVAVQYGVARAGDVPRNYSSIARITTDLGFVPAVSLHEGLEKTWAWFQENALPVMAAKQHGSE